jgi:murein L,D-transpeptidase YcbB/YkuD
MTAWVDRDNRLQFRNDIYHRDRDLNTALKQRPQPATASGHDG